MMIKILKSKWIFMLFALSLFFSGQKVLAWSEYPTNPVYDPIIAAEKAYYPSVLKMGVNDYRMWYQSNSTSSNTTVAYATSNDGISWTMVTNAVSGLLPDNAGHPHVEFVDGKYRIWYWNAATPYGNNAMHYAESVDGITWTNDSAITGNLTNPTGGLWNSGIYGAVDVIINDSPINTGTNPFDYKYAMYYDATSGGYEQIALGYSIDGINWTLYGTGPVLPKGPVGSWDSSYVAIGSTVIKGTFWTMWYSGGISRSNEGIGCATSVDGLEWTKCPNNPAMHKSDGVAWRNSRTYTPKIIRDGNTYKMWFTGQDTVTSNYAIGYATSDPLLVSGNLYLKKKSGGEVALPIGTNNIVLDNESVLNFVNAVNTESGGTIIIADVVNTLSNFTNGDLIGVDLSVPKNVGGKSVTVGKAIKLSSGSSGTSTKIKNFELANVDVNISDATTILASSGWDGIITPPKTAITSGDIAPTGFSIGTAIDVGSPTEVLLFDKPVQVSLVGITGSVGYKPAGLTTWIQITNTCDGTYDMPILSSASFPGECSITNGVDTKILTYHLTTFGELTPIPSVPATLHVIKLIINEGGGTAAPSDFTVHLKNSGVDVSGSPTVGTAAPGISYSLTAGTYVVSEDANTSYTQSFSGDCDSNGSITLLAGNDKICTIINTNILPPIVVPSAPSGGSYYPSVVVPVIGILTTPNPLALPLGSDLVTYNYTVWNVSKERSLTDISVIDDKCSSITLLSGDLNGNKKLDSNELWEYNCTVMVSDTTTNTSIVTGYSDDAHHQAAIATAITTVVVNTSVPRPLINLVKLPNRLTPFPFGGGDVIYTYTVANPGLVPINNVTVIDDKCSSVSYVSGDVNGNKLLDPDEVWSYTCQTNVLVSTRSVAMTVGRANGVIAVGYAFTDVLVTVPSFPSTGLQSGKSVFVGSTLLNIRESPSLSGLIIGQAPIKTQGVLMDVPAIKKDNYNWVQVGYQNGFTGWSVTAGLFGGDSVLSQLISPIFKIGDKIMIIREMNVRKGAGINESIINSQIKGGLGVIVGGGNQKDGYTWWQIKYDNDLMGWTAEIGLTK